MDDVGLLPKASDLEALTDPAQRIIVSCERAKTWLAQALEGDDIEQIVEIKSQAEAIRVYTMQKQLGKDAELSAMEIVRRAERCIGLAIRKGQAEGRIAKPGDIGGGRKTDPAKGRICTTTEATAGMASDEISRGPYALTDDISDEKFENALDQAKAELNLSRNNLVRKMKGDSNRWQRLAKLAAHGHTSNQIATKLGHSRSWIVRKAAELGITIHADRVVGKSRRRHSPDRVLTEFTDTLESLVPSCDLIEPEKINRDVVIECAAVIDDAMRALGKLRRRLKKEIEND